LLQAAPAHAGELPACSNFSVVERGAKTATGSWDVAKGVLARTKIHLRQMSQDCQDPTADTYAMIRLVDNKGNPLNSYIRAGYRQWPGIFCVTGTMCIGDTYLLETWFGYYSSTGRFVVYDTCDKGAGPVACHYQTGTVAQWIATAGFSPGHECEFEVYQNGTTSSGDFIWRPTWACDGDGFKRHNFSSDDSVTRFLSTRGQGIPGGTTEVDGTATEMTDDFLWVYKKESYQGLLLDHEFVGNKCMRDTSSHYSAGGGIFNGTWSVVANLRKAGC